MHIGRSILFVIAMTSPFLATGMAQGIPQPHAAHTMSSLAEEVRNATGVFRDSREAERAGYGPVLGCVTGPVTGAMGVHFVNPTLLMDNVVDAGHPEALMYEYDQGVARLTGVEFIVIASAWHQSHPEQEPPILGGQLFQFVDAPNRFGLPAHYELHVWAWRENPNGTFVDWNPLVSCDGH